MKTSVTDMIKDIIKKIFALLKMQIYQLRRSFEEDFKTLCPYRIFKHFKQYTGFDTGTTLPLMVTSPGEGMRRRTTQQAICFTNYMETEGDQGIKTRIAWQV